MGVGMGVGFHQVGEGEEGEGEEEDCRMYADVVDLRLWSLSFVREYHTF